MKNVNIVIEEETDEDKRKFFALTDYPDTYIKLEAAEREDDHKYNTMRSVEALVRTVLYDHTTYFEESPEGLYVEFDRPVYKKADEMLFENRKGNIRTIYTRKIPGQYHIEIPLDNLAARIFQRYNMDRFIEEYHRIKTKHKPIVLPEYSSSPSEFSKSILKFLKLPYRGIDSFLHMTFSTAFLNTKFFGTVEDFLDRELEKHRRMNEAENEIVWESVKADIDVKRKISVYNKYINPPCSHMIQPNLKDLTLKGDFFVCSHGNNVLCRHINEDVGEKQLDGTIICPYCGEILMRNPVYVKLTSSHSEIDDVKKFIFGRSLQYVARINFNAIVTSDFINKFAGNITDSIYHSVNNYFHRLNKLRGISEDIAASMREVITVIHIYVAILLLATKNPGLIVYKNASGNFDQLKRFMIKEISSQYVTHLQKINIVENLNLDNIFSTILEQLSVEKIYIPLEFNKFDVKSTILYRYFCKEPCTSYPVIPEKPEDTDIQRLFKRLLLQKNYIDENMRKWVEYLETFDDSYYVPHIVQPNLTSCRILDNNSSALGYIYGLKGGFHKHKWNICIGKKCIDPKFVEIREAGESLICQICGESGSANDHISEILFREEIKKSKDIYYKNFCPEKTEHRGFPCQFCGYGSPKFYDSYQLPTKSLAFPEKTKDVKFEDIPSSQEIFPKFAGSLSKVAYLHFWKTFCQYEDVTYKNLLNGKTGDTNIAYPKLLGFMQSLNIFLSRIPQEFSPYIKFADEYKQHRVADLIPQIAATIDQFYHSNGDQYAELMKHYIKYFNQLPTEIAEFWFKHMLKTTETSALSEESVKAAALISHKTKILNEEIQEIEGDGGGFNYENIDYNGENEEMA